MMQWSQQGCNVVRPLLLLFVVFIGFVWSLFAVVQHAFAQSSQTKKPRQDLRPCRPLPSHPKTGHNMVQLTIQDMDLHCMMSLYHLMLIVNHVVAVMRKGNLV